MKYEPEKQKEKRNFPTIKIYRIKKEPETEMKIRTLEKKLIKIIPRNPLT